MRGGHAKKYGFNRGGKGKEILGVEGGCHQRNSFKFCSDGICNNANNLPECQKPVFQTFRKFRFSLGSMPPGSLLYYAHILSL